jgi:1-acyl-sn-glycerol-3-phosphate acyltransferase
MLGVRITKMEQKNKIKKTSPYLILSNHISFLDSFVNLYLYQNTFVCKGELLEYPVVGKLLQSLDALFLFRTDKNSKSAVLDKIGDRAKSVDIPLLIYPEGTVSNGNGLLELKKGIFVNNNHLLVSILKYKSEYDVMLDYYGQATALLGILCNWGVEVEVTSWWVEGREGTDWK